MVPTVDHNVFSTLSDDDRRAVLATMVRRRYRKGDTLFHEGETGDLLYVLERGRVAIRVSTSLGDVATLTVLGPGASFGEQALLDHSTVRTASAVALESVEAPHSSASTSTTFAVSTRPSTGCSSRSSRRRCGGCPRTSSRRSTCRWRCAWCAGSPRLAALYGDTSPIEVPLRQDDLASMAGTTRPTANRSSASSRTMASSPCAAARCTCSTQCRWPLTPAERGRRLLPCANRREWQEGVARGRSGCNRAGGGARPYVPDLLRDWPDGCPWQELDGTLVSADITGFTTLTERLAERGREGAEELNCSSAAVSKG